MRSVIPSVLGAGVLLAAGGCALLQHDAILGEEAAVVTLCMSTEDGGNEVVTGVPFRVADDNAADVTITAVALEDATNMDLRSSYVDYDGELVGGAVLPDDASLASGRFSVAAGATVNPDEGDFAIAIDVVPAHSSESAAVRTVRVTYMDGAGHEHTVASPVDFSFKPECG